MGLIPHFAKISKSCMTVNICAYCKYVAHEETAIEKIFQTKCPPSSKVPLLPVPVTNALFNIIYIIRNTIPSLTPLCETQKNAGSGKNKLRMG